MISLELKYRFWFVTLIKKYRVPQSWNELTEHQFAVCASIHLQQTTEIEFLKQFFLLPEFLVRELDTFQIYKIVNLLNFTMQPSTGSDSFFFTHIPGTSLRAPGSKLQTTSFEQFALFDTFFFEYANNPTDDNLVKFISTLYIKKGETVTDIDIDKRQEYIKKHCSKRVQYAIFLNYIFLRKWLSKSFRFLFEDNESEDEEEPVRKRRPVQPVKKNNRPDWVAIIDNFVGDDILNYDKYKLMPCYLAFKTINNRIKNFRQNGK